MHEPARIRQGRGRPKKDNKTTRRLPSAFKLTQGRVLAPKTATTASSSATPTIQPPIIPPITASLSPPKATPTAASLPQQPTATTLEPGKKRTQGPDKQPRKKKTQTQKGRGGNRAAETVAETKDAVARQRGLEALQEAAVDKDIENSN